MASPNLAETAPDSNMIADDPRLWACRGSSVSCVCIACLGGVVEGFRREVRTKKKLKSLAQLGVPAARVRPSKTCNWWAQVGCASSSPVRRAPNSATIERSRESISLVSVAERAFAT